MPCPTCDKTLQAVYQDKNRKIFHCAVCGTMRSEFYAVTAIADDTRPALVDRLRKFVDSVAADARLGAEGAGALLDLFQRAGILEAIDLPADRYTF